MAEVDYTIQWEFRIRAEPGSSVIRVGTKFAVMKGVAPDVAAFRAGEAFYYSLCRDLGVKRPRDIDSIVWDNLPDSEKIPSDPVAGE